MGLSKRQIIAGAFSELGIGAYAYDLQPEQLQEALQKLDGMMATWSGRGIRLGYSGGNGSGELDVETDVPAWADEAMTLGLAVRIAPSFGKTPSLDTKISAHQAFLTVLGKGTQSRSRSMAGYAGAGSGYRQLVAPRDDIQTGFDGILDLGSAG